MRSFRLPHLAKRGENNTISEVIEMSEAPWGLYSPSTFHASRRKSKPCQWSLLPLDLDYFRPSENRPLIWTYPHSICRLGWRFFTVELDYGTALNTVCLTGLWPKSYPRDTAHRYPESSELTINPLHYLRQNTLPPTFALTSTFIRSDPLNGCAHTISSNPSLIDFWLRNYDTSSSSGSRTPVSFSTAFFNDHGVIEVLDSFSANNI